MVAEPAVPVVVYESQIPPYVYDLLVRRHNQIALIELLAALTALSAFSPFIKGKDIRFFIDNRVAECAVRNGYVRRDTRDACELVSELWFQLQQAQATVWVDRVPSELNIADGPSRPNKPELSAPLWRLNREVRYLTNVTVPEWAVTALENSLARRWASPRAEPRCALARCAHREYPEERKNVQIRDLLMGPFLCLGASLPHWE